MKQTLRVMVLTPGEEPEVREIYQSDMPDIVGGDIQVVEALPEIYLIENDCAMLLQLPVNRIHRDHVIVGTAILVGLTYRGEYRSLTDKEVEICMLEFYDCAREVEWDDIPFAEEITYYN